MQKQNMNWATARPLTSISPYVVILPHHQTYGLAVLLDRSPRKPGIEITDDKMNSSY